MNSGESAGGNGKFINKPFLDLALTLGEDFRLLLGWY
tara:strand:- start:3 stop:113 length:111 start_codon:yes stop_codon:yes gene_type:complete